jgi:hypothetical protein
MKLRSLFLLVTMLVGCSAEVAPSDEALADGVTLRDDDVDQDDDSAVGQAEQASTRKSCVARGFTTTGISVAHAYRIATNRAHNWCPGASRHYFNKSVLGCTAVNRLGCSYVDESSATCTVLARACP